MEITNFTLPEKFLTLRGVPMETTENISTITYVTLPHTL